MGEHHGSKHRRGNCLHNIHVATTEQDIVIEWGIDNLNVNKNGFTPEFNGNILEEPFGRRWSSVISSKVMARWYEIGGAKFLPYGFGHDACGCTFINDASMNCDVPYFNWYLKNNESGEARFSTIDIKCDESGIDGVDYPQGRK
jgi:hypothetical protein